MSTCREVKELLPGYVDARLPVDALATVRGHLEACADCARERAALERTDALVEAALSDHPWNDAGVESLVLDLRERARAQATTTQATTQATTPRRDDERPGRGAGWAAAAAVLVAAGALLWSSGREPQPVGVVAVAPATLGRAGSGLMRAGRDGAYEVVAEGDPVRAGDRLLAVAEGAQVRLDDGTRVLIHPDTEVALRAEQDGGVTLALGGLDGEVYCEVAKRRAPFRVSARGLDVEVLGTRFLVNHGRQASRVVVLEGRVMASTLGDRKVLERDDVAEAREGEQALRTSRVTGPVWGQWVPSVAEELRRRFTTPAAPTPPPAPPVERSPLDPPPAPPGPPQGELDNPVVPPSPPR